MSFNLNYIFLYLWLVFISCAEVLDEKPGIREYDYIVVGGGTAGGTLAVELAKAGYSTLLIEGGPWHTSVNDTVPAFCVRAFEDPDIGSEFFPRIYAENDTQHQDTAFYPRVGALGGCSIHNGMTAVYPNKRDFDTLVKATGDETFDEPHMREYFKRMEKNYYPKFMRSSEAHGDDGFFPTSFNDFIKIADIKKLNLFRSFDLQAVKLFTAFLPNPFHDLNGYSKKRLGTDVESSFFIPTNIDPTTGTRGNYLGYIVHHAQKLPNFDIWTNTYATRIVIDSQVAYGVEYQYGKYLYKASPHSNDQNRAQASRGVVAARREIIISGGFIQTPQLLMLSGIGDRDQLALHNINTSAHLPGVGRNLQENYETSYIVQLPKEYSAVKGCKFSPSMDDYCYRQYVERRAGPYITNGFISGRLSKSRPELDTPDIFTYTTGGYIPRFYIGHNVDIAKHLNTFTRVTLKAHSTNPGVIKLKSSDPFDVPDINFQFFQQDGEEDIIAIVDNIKKLRMETKKKFSKYEELRPGKEVATDEELVDFVRKETFGHHGCCTAKIGNDDDPMAVLDGRFRVRGIKRLRVVDGSAFPETPGYFPVLFTHMLALKAADIILEDAKKQP
ncbi:uncharacterized protein VTP21DRAFT_5308 [Calcarisporiella thermophila]|uniref:uncharacterized protein n=1 Tax=Calcarisporiella thermophila TaxID=911321 RepID=UPI003741EF25